MRAKPEIRVMAERLARVRFEELWNTMPASTQELEITRMVFFLSVVERAGMTLVEAEDGR
jgi:hypothetical protein